MQFYYGDDEMYLRVLDETEFWKHQEGEHITVIREIVPELDEATDTQLQEFEQNFHQTHQKTVELIETLIRSKGQINKSMKQYITDTVSYALDESEEFVRFLQDMLKISQVAEDPIAKAVINHIIRESEYFIGIAQTIFYGST